MGPTRRSVGAGTLALVLPFAGCTQLTAHETAGQVEVSVVDSDGVYGVVWLTQYS